jgi:hypothetical protein
LYKASKAVGRASSKVLAAAKIYVSELRAILDVPEETPLDNAKLVGAVLDKAVLEV